MESINCCCVLIRFLCINYSAMDNEMRTISFFSFVPSVLTVCPIDSISNLLSLGACGARLDVAVFPKPVLRELFVPKPKPKLPLVFPAVNELLFVPNPKPVVFPVVDELLLFAPNPNPPPVFPVVDELLLLVPKVNPLVVFPVVDELLLFAPNPNQPPLPPEEDK